MDTIFLTRKQFNQLIDLNNNRPDQENKQEFQEQLKSYCGLQIQIIEDIPFITKADIIDTTPRNRAERRHGRMF